jgi:hypothetical protein
VSAHDDIEGDDALGWYDVTIKLDDDDVRRYAVEAASVQEAQDIAWERMPAPDFRIVPMSVEPEHGGIFDDVIEHDT